MLRGASYEEVISDGARGMVVHRALEIEACARVQRLGVPYFERVVVGAGAEGERVKRVEVDGCYTVCVGARRALGYGTKRAVDYGGLFVEVLEIPDLNRGVYARRQKATSVSVASNSMHREFGLLSTLKAVDRDGSYTSTVNGGLSVILRVIVIDTAGIAAGKDGVGRLDGMKQAGGILLRKSDRGKRAGGSVQEKGIHSRPSALIGDGGC